MSAPLVVMQPKCPNCDRMQKHLERMAVLCDRAYRDLDEMRAELDRANTERQALLQLLDIARGKQVAFAA